MDAFWWKLAAVIGLSWLIALGPLSHKAYADTQDDLFFYTLGEEGIFIADHDAALNNVARLCGDVYSGSNVYGRYSVNDIAAAINQVEEGLDFRASKVFVLTALRFYCPPSIAYKAGDQS